MQQQVEKSCGILGAGGLLGRTLAKVFSDAGYQVTGITRENYVSHIGEKFDVFINTNGNSKKFWANQHPEEDYALNVESVGKSIEDFSFGIYVYISSSDVYASPGNPEDAHEDAVIDPGVLEPYGKHKYQAEILVSRLPKYLIIRPCALIGPGLSKGLVKDIESGSDLFVSRDSQLQLITTSEVGKAIVRLLEAGVDNQVYNCAGTRPIEVSEALGIMGKVCGIRPEAKKQMYFLATKKLEELFPLKSSQEYLKEYLYESGKQGDAPACWF